jgi:hypothetical protein
MDCSLMVATKLYDLVHCRDQRIQFGLHCCMQFMYTSGSSNCIRLLMVSEQFKWYRLVDMQEFCRNFLQMPI